MIGSQNQLLYNVGTVVLAYLHLTTRPECINIRILFLPPTILFPIHITHTCSTLQRINFLTYLSLRFYTCIFIVP